MEEKVYRVVSEDNEIVKEFSSRIEAENKIYKMEEEDRRNNCYQPGFYDIKEIEKEVVIPEVTLYRVKDGDFILNKPEWKSNILINGKSRFGGVWILENTGRIISIEKVDYIAVEKAVDNAWETNKIENKLLRELFVEIHNNVKENERKFYIKDLHEFLIKELR